MRHSCLMNFNLVLISSVLVGFCCWHFLTLNHCLILILSLNSINHKVQPHWRQVNNTGAHFFRFYGNDTSGTCEPCDPSCVECSGSDETHCLGCTDGYFLLKHKGICVHVCPSDHYSDIWKKVCQRCHPSCKTCESRPLNVVWSFSSQE